MAVLHIACGASYSNIYFELFNVLKEKEVGFSVYVPQHYSNKKTYNEDDYGFKLYSNKIIKPYDKFLYFTKIKRMEKDLISNIGLSNHDLLHAHSLFSDGGVAFSIFKKYRIPYIVAIRDTDVNKYFRMAIHLRTHAINIMENAYKIVFLSDAYRQAVLNEYVPDKKRNSLFEKSVVIPNGINSYWLNNKHKNIKKNEKVISIIFVGQIIKRKNIEGLLHSLNIAEKKSDKSIKLMVIGKKVDEKYFEQLKGIREFEYISPISKEELIKYYRKSDIFAMPSHTETFGLVYAEAMSQGLPVIYTKGQGFDTQFNDGEVGYKVSATDIEGISDKILLAYKNKKRISEACIEKVGKFDWDGIVEKYIDIYHSSKTYF